MLYNFKYPGNNSLKDVEQITKTDRFTRVTPFAEKANPAPRYGGLVPPLDTNIKTPNK
jgi:hypothetical protein